MQPMPEDWDRAVAVVAHPDDLEYGVASAVARWTGQGKKVTYILATKGEAGIAGMPPGETVPLRMEEEHRSAEVVGVSAVDFRASCWQRTARTPPAWPSHAPGPGQQQWVSSGGVLSRDATG